MIAFKNCVLRIIYPTLFKETVLKSSQDVDIFFHEIEMEAALADRRGYSGRTMSRRFWTILYRIEDWLLEEDIP